MTDHVPAPLAQSLFDAIPVLTTERLILRGYRESDLEPFAAFYASNRSHFVGGPLTAERACRGLMTYAGHWHIRGYGRWMVEDRATGAVLGNVGLWFPEGWPEPEIGWTLFDNAIGRGIAHEAAMVSRAYACGTLGWSTVVSLIAPDNAPSLRLAQRLGARHEGEFRHELYGELQIWRHPGPEAAP